MDKKLFGVGFASLLFCFVVGFFLVRFRGMFSELANSTGLRFMLFPKKGLLVPQDIELVDWFE